MSPMMKLPQNKHTTLIPKRAGFTLIEMMVSLSIFSIIMLIALGSILTIVDANRKTQTIQAVVNNLDFALETMSRNIRVGSTYRCQNGFQGGANNYNNTQDCGGGGRTHLTFEGRLGDPASNADQITYFYDAAAEAVFRQIGTDESAENQIRLTSEEVVVEGLSFLVDGSQSGTGSNAQQPFVRIRMWGYALIGSTRTNFNLQTAVTQRMLDL